MLRALTILALILGCGAFSHAEERDWHRTALRSQTPDGEILHLTAGNSAKPNVIERWWNGKRVRWLDETGCMRPDDVRGDMVGSVLQVDLNDDGVYDGPGDLTVKWCDTNNDGVPDVQAVILTPKHWTEKGKLAPGDHADWMIMLNHDQRGVLNWIEWSKFRFNCWAHSDACNWLPNFHGNNDFVKTHAPVHEMGDKRLNWENPFSFYDEDGDGVSEMTIRWCAPFAVRNGKVNIPPVLNSAFLSYDLDNNSGKGNETSYDMTLCGSGAEVDISGMRHPLPNFAGDPKFDSLFHHNEWRRIKELVYMDRNESYSRFFQTRWKSLYLTFDEDGDDHRWERLEMYYPTTNYKPNGPQVDIYSTALFNNNKGVTPGLCGAFQSDSLGDRGEFDLDNSGGGKLYIGKFDRKLHLHGAEWGAWTVDENAQFHGGAGEPSNKPRAEKVGEVVKYTDSDGNGFIDTIEYDYDGDRAVDLKVSLLEYGKTADGVAPDVVPLSDPAKLGWKGMHELFNRMAQDAWIEALAVYRAAWRRDLTTPEIDVMAHASSIMERYQKAYWIKEKIFRQLRARLKALGEADPLQKANLDRLLADYVKAYYTGDFAEVVRLLDIVPCGGQIQTGK